MSIAALNWAMEQKTDGPSAQSVIFVIADRANEHGICRHADPDTIAQKTRQSRATVFRRLEEAERVGILTRFVRHLDDGRREYEVRLGMTRYVNYRVDKHRNITLYALDDDKCEGESIGFVSFDGGSSQDIEGESQIETQGESQIETGQVSPVRPDESQSCDSQKSPSKNPKVTPLPPKGGDPQPSIDQESEAKESPKVASWQRFERAWQEPILRQSIARQVWSALTESEEEIAIRAAKGYVVYRHSQKKPPNVINAHTFLRERDAWAGFVALAPPEPPKPKPVTFLPADSDEFATLALSFAIARRLPLRPVDGGAKLSGDVPAGAAGLAALVRFNPETFEVDQSDWTLAAQGSRRYVAWSERIKEWLGSWPEAHRYWLDRAGNIVPTVEQAEGYGNKLRLPKACDGLLLPPFEFPPPKGTGHSITGPPISDEDAETLAHENMK